MNPSILRHLVLAPADESTPGGDDTGTITQAKQAITSTARETASRIKSAASETASRAKTEAQRLASQTKETAADRLGGYSSAMRESAKSFEQQDPNIAWATNQLAEKVDGVADYIRNSDLADLKADVENFARRHPVAFFGGLFLGGLVIGNVLKARQPVAEEEMEEEELPTAGSDAELGGGESTSLNEPTMGGI